MHQHLTHLLTVVATLSLGTPALADVSSPTPRSATAEQRTPDEERLEAPRRVVTPAEEAHYRSLEASSPEAEAYRGGDAIVIGATTATVVLAVVLLIVLL